MYKAFLFFIAISIPMVAAASVAEFKGEPKLVNKVKVYPQVVVQAEGLPATTLDLSGAGVRKKDKLFLTFDVYLVASYFQDPKLTTDKDTPLEAAAKQKV